MLAPDVARTILVVKLTHKHNPKKEKKEATGYKLSQKEKRSNGTFEILKVLSGEAPVNSEVLFQYPQLPYWFSRGRYIQVSGYFDQLTKKSKIFVVNDAFLLSPSALKQITEKHGLNIESERIKAIEDGGFKLVDEAKGSPVWEKLSEIYTQDVAVMNDVLHKAGFNNDIELAYHIVDFFQHRAKVRNYESVSDMIESNPLILADLEDFRLDELKKSMRSLGVKLPPEAEVYAELSNMVWNWSRRGHSYVPLAYVAMRLQAVLSAIGVERNKQYYYLATLGQTLPSNMPHPGLSKILTSSSKDLECMGDDIQAFYTKAYEEVGNEKAQFWGKIANSGIALARTSFSERKAAKIIASKCRKHSLPQVLSDVEELTSLNSKQKEAIINALTNQISCIVGPAGTGKSYTISKLVDLLQKHGDKSIILAPSAMAAVVAASKVAGTGIEYSTIHRFAKILPSSEDYGETDIETISNEEAITKQFVILDEMSMCDISTFYSFLNCIKDNLDVHIVLVGDCKQLLSIGPSGFFHQIAYGLLKEWIPVVELTEVLRSDNKITAFATSIRSGKFPVIEAQDPIKQSPLSLENIRKIAKKFKSQKTPFNDILFLSSSVKGEFGTDKLNSVLRKVFLPNDALQVEDISYFVGDPVISVKNDYAKTKKTGRIARHRHPERDFDVYNGTRGIIEGWDEETNTITVRFFTTEGEKVTSYTSQELPSWLTVAYAISVHKAQGSEAEIVVFVKSSNTRTISQNMLYTAVTRAKKEIYLFGDNWEDVPQKAIPVPYSKFAFRVKDFILKEAEKARSAFEEDVEAEVW